jgi:hypothetical protein
MTMNRWSRRKFLETGVAGAITVTGARASGLFPAQKSGTPPQEIAKNSIAKLHRDLLRASMDELIPAGDGMPSASEAGGVDYLDGLAGENEQVAKGLRASLSALEEVSSNNFKESFLSLPREQRIKALVAFEQRDTNSFRNLRSYVYEAYYLQPQVRRLIGYEPHPTNGAGAVIEPFNESVLADVRKKPKHYREI